MQVIIFDKSVDSDPTGVGVISPAPKYTGTLEDLAAKVVPSGSAWEIVDDAILPWDKPRELWEWV